MVERCQNIFLSTEIDDYEFMVSYGSIWTQCVNIAIQHLGTPYITQSCAMHDYDALARQGSFANELVENELMGKV